MEIFLSGEIEGPASAKWVELQRECAPLLSKLEDKNYGEDLTSIGIISILMRDEYLANGLHPEKRYYSRKRKEADIRMWINYKEFSRSNKEQRKKIYIDHIIESIRVAGKKAGKGFDTELLVKDVREILD